MNISLRQLEYFVAVAEHRNFTRAAASCHVTQPSLSEQLRHLEGALGVELFERDRRPVGLTDAGEALVDRARTVLDSARGVVEAAHTYLQPLVGTLRLGVIPTVAPYLLPSIVAQVHEAFSGLRLYLAEDQTERLLDQLEAGKLDILLLALEVDLREHESLELVRDEFQLAMPADHRLASQEQVFERDLQGEQVLLLGDGHCLRDHALSVCDKAGAVTDVDDFRAGSLSTLTQMVSLGLGLTLLPTVAKAAEERACAPAGLAVRPFAEPRPRRTIGLVWRRRSSRTTEFQMLGDQIRKVCAVSGYAIV